MFATSNCRTARVISWPIMEWVVSSNIQCINNFGIYKTDIGAMYIEATIDIKVIRRLGITILKLFPYIISLLALRS